MLFRTRKKPKYLNDKIEKEVKEKGFSVYNYISLKELILTARKDFLGILSKINIALMVITIILWIISYYSSLFFILPVFLFIIFFLIFLYIFIKLIFRTKLFLYISNVVYTKTGLMISDDYLYYSKDKKKLDKKLKKYEAIFDEYLSRSSNLKEVISKKKKEVLDESVKTSWSIVKWMTSKRIGSSRKTGWAVLIVIVSLILYVMSLYIFYYLWYFVLYFLWKIYSFILWFFISFKNKIELKIKNRTLWIEQKLDKMNIIYKVLKNKIDNFKDWEISDIWNFTEDKFSDFYNQIDLVLKDVKDLKFLIETSKYSNVIDFNIFKTYLKKKFNAPVKDMVWLLEVYEKLLNKQILEFKRLNNNTQKQELDINNIEILDKNLEQKEFVLNKKLEALEKNKSVLKRSILV